MKKDLAKKIGEMTDVGLNIALIIFALIAIYVALFVKSKWVKAAVLAWEIMP